MPYDKIKIVIVDDHPIVMEGLKNLLEKLEYISVISSFPDGKSMLSFLQNNQTDIVLLDISLPDTNGMDLCKTIKKQSPDTLVLMLSNHTERSMVMQSIQNGANGYLLKNASLDELRNSIASALAGNIAFTKEVNEIIHRPTHNELSHLPQITKREKEILKLIAEGKTSHQIAEMLFLSPLTIDTHRKNLIQKFEVKNAAELIRKATQHQLI